MATDPWGAFPDAPKASPVGKGGDQWDAFPDHPVSAPPATLTTTGEAHDGDTLRLSDGSNGRVYGIDAFELGQTGVGPDGKPVPLGQYGRDWLRSNLSPRTSVTPTGATTYHRPVVMLDNNGQDPALGELGAGWALSEPQYLRGGDPQRFVDYTQAERDARMNRRGAFGTDFITPSAFRHGGSLPATPGAPDPWQQAEWHSKPQTGDQAVFFDEPTPFQGLKPEVERGYLSIWTDRNSKPEDLIAFAHANGIQLNPQDVRIKFAARDKLPPDAPLNTEITYAQPPRVLTNPGDGALGALGRGVADPLNTLDEEGAFADTFGLTKGRESMFNSDRRFADIYYNNLEQNRAILGYDDEHHPYARTTGQIAGALVIPAGAVEDVGLAAARQVLREGGTRYAAEQAAKAAVRQRLAQVGAAEGAAAGFGHGENMHDRLVGAAEGGVTGYGAGLGTGAIGQAIAARFGSRARRLTARAGDDAAPVENQRAAPEPGAVADAVTAPPVPAATARPAPRVVTGADLRALHTDGSGAVDVGEAGVNLRNIADQALADGSDVTLHVDGKAVPITAPGLTDAAGQRWGAMPLLTEGEGGANRLEITPRTADMAAEHGGESLTAPEGVSAPEAPSRQPDRIDVGPPTVHHPDAPGKPYPILSDATQAQRAAQAQDIRPGDVMPLADSSVASADEAAAIGAGKYAPIKAPNENDALASRAIPSPVDGSRTIPKRGPLDLVTWLRTQGGIKPQGGELAHYGIDNAPRKGMDFAGGENRFGKLVDPENGMSYDEAAQRAHEAGDFPDHTERPTTAEFLDALHATHTGRQRSFLPEDYPELDAHQAARAQRHAVEAARQDGTTLVEDRGQPVGLHDVEANTPPVHAYEEWGDQAPDYAGNIKLGNLDSPQSIKRALTVTEQRVGGFDAATRGRITHAETEALAADMGMTPAQLLSRRKGQAFNAEEALAARQILAKSGNELVNMARKISSLDNPGDELMAKFREAWTRHVAIQEQVAGMTAEAGRALGQFRAMADSRAVKGEVLKSLAEGPFGADQMRKAADAIVENADNPAALNRAALKASRAPWKDKLVELYYNSILSGPQTHAVNMMSNTMTAIGQIPEHAVAAAIGLPRAIARSAGADDRVLFSELGSRVVGMLEGTKEGMRQAARTFRTGITPDHVNKVEGTEAAAISGLKGKIIRTPTRALSAADELYKAIARRSEIAGLAVRQAAKEGLRGDAGRARAAALTANPTDDMVRQSFDYARYVTFQRQLGPFGQHISQITQKAPILKLVLPFVRTPTNIMKFAVERSPAAPLLREWRADMIAGGARRDLALAKVAVGTGAMATVMHLYSQGLITGGGPADPSAKAAMRADGWQPYSVKIGDKYYSYARLDPYATTLGVAADYADLQSHMTTRQRDEAAGLLLSSTIKNLADKTWFSGVADLTNAVTDSDRYAPAYIRNRVASTVVPSLVSQTAKAYDDTMRAPKNFLDAIRSRIPVWSQSVPGRLDVWGRTVPNEGGVGPNIISPVWQSRALHDPVNAAVLSTGAHVSAPGRYVGGRQLEDGEYNEFAQAAGKLAHERVGDLIAGPSWSMIPAERRADAIEDVVRGARAEVRGRMFGARGVRLTPGAAPSGGAPERVPTSFDDPMFKDAH